MNRTVLIAGRDNALIYELTKRYLKLECNVICTLSKTKLPEEYGSVEADFSRSLLSIDINWKSPLSVRSLLLKGLTKFESFTEAIIIQSPLNENRPLHDIPFSAIEEFIDTGMKGMMFLSKELLYHFMKRKEGYLFPVLFLSGSEVLPSLDASLTGAFTASVESMFLFYKNEPIIINAFESKTANAADFADFIVKNIQEKAKTTYGKWFKYNEKPALFSSLSKSLPGFKR